MERKVKKYLVVLLILFINVLYVNAEEISGFKYKGISLKSRISYNSSQNKWTKGCSGDKCFIKTKGFGVFSDYLNTDKSFAFTTDCEFEFIADGKFIGYSNKDLKFYNIKYSGAGINKTELTYDEVCNLLPDYKVIKISEFSTNTNSLKIKKGWGDLKLVLFNDTNKTFNNYVFSSGNAKFESSILSGVVVIYKPGMIQFSSANGSSSENPWYVILVR